MNTAVIIVAGGKSRRFGASTPKQFLTFFGKPLFLWSVLAFKKVKDISQIVLVVPKEKIQSLKKYEKLYGIDITSGGKERFASVRLGLKKLNSTVKYVAIHDAARPFIKPKIISDTIFAAKKYGAAVVAVKAVDTIKFSKSNNTIDKTIPRQNVWFAQTPQIFKRNIIEAAYKCHLPKTITDDAQVVEFLGKKVKLIEGSYDNIKITTKRDIAAIKSVQGK
jgi:2-C-methyl-D-erythritol 4-phosphate cytidylyltransferase